MNWQAVQAIAELLAAGGVVASLLYLAAQIGQNTRSMQAATMPMPSQNHPPARALGLFVVLGLTACSSDGTGPNDSDPLVLQWPVAGEDGADWVINNYVDLDTGAGVLDYRGGGKSYDGHPGVDIDVPNFRWMDSGHQIVAAHAGEVVSLSDGQPDRNTSCVGTANFVDVRHDDGSTMTYGHLKQSSIVVTIGQQVSAGDALAVVGSSGCSTAPHLHLELRDEGGTVVDPFLEELFAAPPTYDAPLDFMDLNVKEGAIPPATSPAEIVSPRARS